MEYKVNLTNEEEKLFLQVVGTRYDPMMEEECINNPVKQIPK